jgi:diguanylate cyclase (GGDEF)-like protein/PAS domain S-box-containing protein
MSEAVQILLIGRDSGDGRSIRAALADGPGGPFVVEVVAHLADGLERLHDSGVAAVLLDLDLPDSRGIVTFEAVLKAAPHVPILVIGSPDDDPAVGQAVTHGAQDYLQRAAIDRYTLPRLLSRIIERQAADESLFFERQRAEVTLASIGDAVLSTDSNGRVTYLNPVAERMTGWPHREAIGRPLADVLHILDASTRERARDPMDQAVRLDRTVGLTPGCTLLVHRDGLERPIEDSASPIRDRRGRAIGSVMVFRDVSEARASSLRAVYLAQHDFLTELPNRMLLMDRLGQAIAFSRRHGQRLAVLFLDLDGFKQVNDSVGHAVGDLLLQSVARRLVGCVRASDTVSRQGGDEFVVLLSEIGHADDATAMACQIRAALAAPHEIAHHRLRVTAAIGFSIYPDDATDGEGLIACADAAMYRSRNATRATGTSSTA